MLNKTILGIIMAIVLIAGVIAGGGLLPKADKQIELSKDCKTALENNGWNNLKLGVTSCLDNGICQTSITNYDRQFDTLVFNEGRNIQTERDKAMLDYLNNECKKLNPIPITKTDKLGDGSITLKEKK